MHIGVRIKLARSGDYIFFLASEPFGRDGQPRLRRGWAASTPSGTSSRLRLPAVGGVTEWAATAGDEARPRRIHQYGEVWHLRRDPDPSTTRPDLAAMVDLCSSVSLRAQSECLTEEEDRGADE
jgi:hypothetical protein